MTSPLTILSVANGTIIRKTNISYLAGLFIGPALSILIIVFVDLEPGHPEVTHTLAVAILMAVWWVTEVIPLAVTSLIPVVLFPLLGIMKGEDISSTYFNHVIFLFIGGFIVALAMERWNLHKRIALKILIFCGISSARILMGFMLPVATPPNAIVFGTNRLRIIQMVRTGLLLNLVGVILITLIVYFWGTFILDIDVSSLPEWAETVTGRP